MASSRFVLGIVVSGGFHVLAFLHMHDAKASARRVSPTTVIEIDTPPAPKPEPLAEVTEASAALAPLRAPPRSAVVPSHAVAEAGKVLAAADNAPGVADFTMVHGTGTYVGGITSSNGTSKTAVTGAPQAVFAAGTGSGGSGTPPTGPDLSKPARPIGNDWDCKALFPLEAKDVTATVLIVARVRPDGSPESVSVVTDPGQGFGLAARACAMRQHYAAAEDRDGRKVPAATAPFRVRFTR